MSASVDISWVRAFPISLASMARQPPMSATMRSVGNMLALAKSALETARSKKAQIVLSNSTIISVNAGTHSDLYSALKGGGANFGKHSFPVTNPLHS